MKEQKYHLYLSDDEYRRVLQSLIRLKNSLIHKADTPTAPAMFSAGCFQPRKESSKSNISEHEKRPPTLCKRSLIIYRHSDKLEVINVSANIPYLLTVRRPHRLDGHNCQ